MWAQEGRLTLAMGKRQVVEMFLADYQAPVGILLRDRPLEDVGVL